jgi:hypothetical protein
MLANLREFGSQAEMVETVKMDTETMAVERNFILPAVVL